MTANEQTAVLELGIQLKSNHPSHELAAVRNKVNSWSNHQTSAYKIGVTKPHNIWHILWNSEHCSSLLPLHLSLAYRTFFLFAFLKTFIFFSCEATGEAKVTLFILIQ